MMNATQIRVGMIIVYKGELCSIMSVTHITPGNKRGIVSTKMKRLSDGVQVENRFRSDETVEKAILEVKEMQFLYNDGDTYHFMDNETYEQVALNSDILGDAIKYLLPETNVLIDFHEGRAVGVELPATVNLKVTDTEPAMRGATATGSKKPATLETGLVTNVPQFILIGDVIKVNTTTGEYLEKAK